jgi:regulatory protein
MDATQFAEKIRHYCAYAERCNSDVRRKLSEWKVDPQETEVLLEQLTQEGYLNEERFAFLFVRSKFNLKDWGGQKIAYFLQQKHIPAQYIRSALAQIDSREEDEKVDFLAKKWLQTHPKEDVDKQRQQLIRYLFGKGYTIERIMRRLSER